MQIDENDLGIEYVGALNKVLEIRKNRKQLYQNTFLEDEYDFLIMKLQDKLKRAKINLTSENISNHSYESVEDSLIDLCNYAIFTIAKINRGDTK